MSERTGLPSGIPSGAVTKVAEYVRHLRGRGNRELTRYDLSATHTIIDTLIPPGAVVVGRCRDCRLWEPDDELGWGVCRAVDEDNLGSQTDNTAYVDLYRAQPGFFVPAAHVP
jgi:hypothetical protein